ncbi:MAG: SatD family protein [Methanolobus sp.]|uniref:SatD family protein n=1 Tax=Methanolobus sp. TaxID=1874737 RepID=UPI002731B617|nr:SatD family protein [Methanolobus sp.]MDP2216118.1 SatD family protein [Methanolobus sp.]
MSGKRILCAVITGDLVRSSEIEYNDRELVVSCLHESFRSVEELLQLHNAILLPFEIFRGDSFQIVITLPERALLVSMLLSLRLNLSNREKDIAARISIGIGTIDYIPASGNVGEADGVAFRLSGKMLDSMKQKDQNLLITTPDPVINLMLETQCAFFDLIAGRWTDIQKELIMEKLSGLTQEEIALQHGKSQSTVSQSLKAAGFDALKKFIGNYENLFKYPGIFLKSDRL